ncbi:hypothetical protein [Catenuloplanes atrovinosus]|uniref:Uncharacterized protein n=1 Tax=Catenuloplanes atrovinosus TaxID=137266 RepID=A0AAE3YS38_9ACTN|nr:hypothetical protein [Catenuloplanes atrovinosus]MDR7277621.1 hypothetical protein [Catenuloplanes atrovinosus]
MSINQPGPPVMFFVRRRASSSSSFDARGGIDLRGCGHADCKAARTVRRFTLELLAIARTDMPA